MPSPRSRRNGRRPLELRRRTRFAAACYAPFVAQTAHHRFSFDEYLRFEAENPARHEFLDGTVWAMSGGTPEHAAVAAKVLALVTAQLGDRKCRAFSSDLRIRVRATGLASYPDGSVVCGKIELDPEDARNHTVTNPIVIVEVLSPSTEAYDLGVKLSHYQQIEALREVLFVAHDRHEVTVVRRDADRWTSEVSTETVTLHSIGCTLSVAEIFRDPLA